MNKELQKTTQEISLRDARRICDALELSAQWDKTEIYYVLKDWIDREDKTGRYHPLSDQWGED